MSVDEKLDAILSRLERMERLHADLLLKRRTLKEEAKAAGVHPSTLSRRRTRERLRRLAGITN